MQKCTIPGPAAAAKLLQSCLTLCNPIDGSPPGSAVPGILQARTLEWAAISFSNVWKWKVKVKALSRVRLLAAPWTAAYQALRSMGFSRQEYWSRVPLPSPKSYTGHPLSVGVIKKPARIEDKSPVAKTDGLERECWGPLGSLWVARIRVLTYSVKFQK